MVLDDTEAWTGADSFMSAGVIGEKDFACLVYFLNYTFHVGVVADDK